jgi:AcrR family transcriptional regulator
VTILAAALELYAERGSDAATMDEIRRRAGVSNGSLFHHFPDRATLEVLVAVVIGPAQEVTHQWLRDPQPGRLRRLATPLADAAWRAVRAGDEDNP